MDINLFQLSSKVVDEVSTYIQKAVVFLDDVSAEVLHWHGGATMLFNCGAVDIRELSAFESGNADQSKAAFFIGGPLSNVSVLDTLQAIITASSFIEVAVFTSVCSPMHSIIEYGPVGIQDDDTKAFMMYRSQIQEWMNHSSLVNDAKYSAVVHYLPLVIAPILSSVFLIPSVGTLFPLLPTDVYYLQQSATKTDRSASVSGSPADIQFGNLPKQLQLQLKLLACNLNSFLEILGCSEDVYAIGLTSNIVATELAGLSWSKARKKNAQLKASILLVDRTLDVAAAVGHFHDTLLDKIVAVLPRLPGHQMDVAVDMSPVCNVVGNSDHQIAVISPGCLGHPEDPASTSLLNAMAVLKQKEALMEIGRLMTDACSKEFRETVKRPVGKSVNADSIRSQLHQFKGKQTNIRRHCGLVQLASAAVQLLQHKDTTKFDSLLAEEKGLLQSVDDDTSPNFIEQIIDGIKHQINLPPNDRSHTVDEFLLLLAFMFSLVGSDSDWRQRNLTDLQASLAQLVLESPKQNLGPVFNALVGEDFDDAKCTDVLQRVLEKLSGLSKAREDLKQYGSIYEPGSLTSQAKLKPMLRQIVEDIVNPNKPDLVDVVHKSAGFGDRLKSGFGLFRSVGKPRPSDNPILIIFLIGGITCTELRQIRETVASSKSNVQIILGSTSLSSPQDVLHRLLVQDNLYPN